MQAGNSKKPHSWFILLTLCFVLLLSLWGAGTIPVAASSITADFTADVTSGAAPFTVNFADLSTGSPTSWAWDFNNDGTTDSTLQNPSYTYTSPGTYTVKLTASNNNDSDDEVKTGYIVVFTPVVGTYIVHTLQGRSDCLSCHDSGGIKPEPVDHAGRTDSTCTLCHSPVPTFTIIASAASGGTISPTGSILVDLNNNATFSITPGPGQQVADVLVDGVSQGAVSTYTFYNVTATHSISATFAAASPAPIWDLNNDHICNIGDVVKIGLKWGLTGTSGWVPEDVNKDGVINIGDVVVVGLHWGQTW